MTTRLVQLVDEWDETTRFDENEVSVLRGLDYEELGERFGLDDNEAHVFWYIIKEEVDIDYCAYGLKEENGNLFLETVQESIHQSYDGWSDEERLVIRAYLADVTWATYQDDRVAR